MDEHLESGAEIEGMKRRAIELERETREKDGTAGHARINSLNLRNRAARLEHLAQDVSADPEAATGLSPMLEETRRLAPRLSDLADLLDEYASGVLIDRCLVRTWCGVAEFASDTAAGLSLPDEAPAPAVRYAALVDETATILEDAAALMSPPGSETEGHPNE